MAKNVLIISSSLRSGSNSEILAKECERGARDAGHHVQGESCKRTRPCAPDSRGLGGERGQ